MFVDAVIQLTWERGDSARSVTAQGEAARQRTRILSRPVGRSTRASVVALRTANPRALPPIRRATADLAGAVSTLVSVPVFGRRVVARDIRFGERMTA